MRPRRYAAPLCTTTHVLLPAALQPRLADATAVIGTALAHKAAGMGRRQIAAALGRSPSTVRRWLRRAREHAHLTRLWQRGAQALIRLDADAFNQLAWTGNRLRDALTVLAAAAWCTEHRLGINEPHGPSSACTPTAGFWQRRANSPCGPGPTRPGPTLLRARLPPSP